MTLPVRHGNSPFLDGDGLPGADLELDIDSLFDIIGEVADTIGRMGNDNCRPNANFDGQKMATVSFGEVKFKNLSVNGNRLADGSVTTAKCVDDSFGALSLAQGAVIAADFDNNTSNTALTASQATINTVNISTASASSSVLLLWSGTYTTDVLSQTMVQRFQRTDTGGTVTLNTFFGFEMYVNTLGGITFSGCPLMLCWVDTGHQQGQSVGWTMQAAQGSGGNMLNGRLLALEFRK